MDSKNSLLFLVPRILSSKNSIASTTLSCDKTLRNIQMRLRSSLAISNSSFLVPDLLMSMAGKTRLSINRRSRIDLHVARAFEFFEDDFVHPAAGIDERRGENGQAAAVLDIARRAEELFRLVKSVGVDTAGENLAARRDDGIIGARQTGNTSRAKSRRLCHVPPAASPFR